MIELTKENDYLKSRKINKKLIFGFAIPIIFLSSYADFLLIGGTSFLNYIFICAWEYCLFWVGFYYGRKNFKGEKTK